MLTQKQMILALEYCVKFVKCLSVDYPEADHGKDYSMSLSWSIWRSSLSRWALPIVDLNR